LIYLNILQNGLNFSSSIYRFYKFKFRVSLSQIAHRDFIANDQEPPPQFILPQSTGLSGLVAMLESYHKCS